MPEFTLQARRRTLFVMASLFALAIALLIRLLDLQILRHDDLVARAQGIIYDERPLHARRGRIFDSKGRPLALNLRGYVLWINGPNFDGNEASRWIVSELCTWAPEGAAALIRVGKTEDLGFFLCSRWVDRSIAEQLKELQESGDLQGISLEEEPRRYYPYGPLVAPVLGYLQDDSALALAATEETRYVAHGGVEEFHDALLRGEEGKVQMEKDPFGFPIPTGYSREFPPVDGAQITLTLDLAIQYQAYKVLVEAVQKAEAKRGDIIVLDPNSGAILAMASYPSYNPNDIFACASNPDCGEYMHVNPPIGTHYEPGSTMKILTIAIALEEHLIRPDSAFECTGEVWVGGIPFHNWNGQAHGHETVSEILLHSCNVGAVTVNMLVDPEVYYHYLGRLGFGQLTGVDMAGEANGTVRSPKMAGWTEVDQAANAFGQAIDVTPLQLAAASSAVANGGDLWQPYIVQKIKQGDDIPTTASAFRGRVFREETCREVTSMLAAIGAVKGKDGGALIPGYRVALKTGTAQIPVPGGDYEPHRTFASAIGYAPADEPQFLILVRIEGNSVIWGEEVAVPVVRDLTGFLLQYLHIPPSLGENTIGP